MKITWLGHSCFLLEDSKGITLLTDPFDSTLGYEVYKGNPNIVTISHNHFDHNYIKELNGECEIVDNLGTYNLNDIYIKGTPSYHDKNKGLKRGDNIIYTFRMDKYSLCHLGDLGHSLSSNDIEAIGDVDILFIPVGGNFTIDGKEASEITKKINPKIVFPMHYKTSKVSLPLDGIEPFVMNMKNALKIDGNTLIINDELNESLSVKILNYI
jgi:L-ascorbate metabolism protein UlaG (beta-lactamase superfamily)